MLSADHWFQESNGAQHPIGCRELLFEYFPPIQQLPRNHNNNPLQLVQDMRNWDPLSQSLDCCCLQANEWVWTLLRQDQQCACSVCWQNNWTKNIPEMLLGSRLLCCTVDMSAWVGLHAATRPARAAIVGKSRAAVAGKSTENCSKMDARRCTEPTLIIGYQCCASQI